MIKGIKTLVDEGKLDDDISKYKELPCKKKNSNCKNHLDPKDLLGDFFELLDSGYDYLWLVDYFVDNGIYIDTFFNKKYVHKTEYNNTLIAIINTPDANYFGVTKTKKGEVAEKKFRNNFISQKIC